MHPFAGVAPALLEASGFRRVHASGMLAGGASTKGRGSSPGIPLTSRRLDFACAAAMFAVAAAYFAAFTPWTRPVILDAATWDYMAVETARGLVPYRDVFLHKTPGAALLGGMAALAGMALGIEPVLAAHALFLFFGALSPVLLFAICRTTGLSRGACLAAAIALLGYDEWTIAALEGCRPKVPTVFFGLASMLAAERARAIPASMLGGISVLCWQPGVAFLLGGWAAILRRGERRPPTLALMVVTSLVPAGLLLSWLAAHGALGDFFDQAVLFNLHYIEDKVRTPYGTLKAIARTVGDWNDLEVLLMPAAIAGLRVARGRRTVAAATSLIRARLPFSVVVSGLIYGAMTFVSYQSWPDAILLGPIVATVLGAGIYKMLRLRLTACFAACLAAGILALAAVPDGRPKFHPPVTFSAQRERFIALAAGLTPDDRVVGVSVPEFFLHSGRRNGWKWPYLWFGVDEFAAAHHPGGFEGMLADLERDPPAMMLVARLWAGPQRARFEEWAAGRYDVSTQRIFPHLKRPLRIYRLRG